MSKPTLNEEQMDQIIDHLINGWEHSETEKDSADFLKESAGVSEKVATEIVREWSKNDGIRLELELNFRDYDNNIVKLASLINRVVEKHGG